MHRAGLDKDGNRVDISVNFIKKLVESSSQLVHDVEARIKQNSESEGKKTPR